MFVFIHTYIILSFFCLSDCLIKYIFIDELAYLNPGLTINVIDNRIFKERKVYDDDGNNISPKASSQSRILRHDGGIAELIRVLCNNNINLYSDIDVITINENKNNVNIQISLRWSKDMYTDNIIGFANGIRTIDGGSHIDGFKTAVTKSLNNVGKKLGKIKDTVAIPSEFLREGLTAVISVKVEEPEFEGQTKTRLGNPEVKQIVESVVIDSLTTLFEQNPALLTVICSKAMEAQNAHLAAKAARDMVRKKSLLHSTILPGKLSDCSSRNPAECEVYIVEGESAAGSAKQGRDRRTQAILPLRGKILNIERATNEKVSWVVVCFLSITCIYVCVIYLCLFCYYLNYCKHHYIRNKLNYLI